MTILFYSWQSDLPNNTNRGFIEECLEKALKSINADIKLEPAVREPVELQQGIEGLPGSRDVAPGIFNRIDECSIFVADISVIGSIQKTSGDARPIPNPNVMIEYGRRTKTCEGTQILPVFNTAYGSWENDRPFDMRHKGPPITYDLPPDHEHDTKAAVKDQLVKRLERAIRDIIQHVAPLKKFEPIPTFEGDPSVWFDVKEPLAIESLGSAKEHYIASGPRAYIRLQPTHPIEEIDSYDALVCTNKVPELLPMRCHEVGLGRDNLRNEYGAVAIGFLGREPSFFTQLHKNGELWGCNTHLLRSDPDIGERWLYIDRLKHVYRETLSNYLEFARKNLELPLPLKLECGLAGVKHYSLPAAGISRSRGRCFEEHVVWEGAVSDYEIAPEEVLDPFYDKIWKDFGLERPVVDRRPPRIAG